MGIFAPAEIVSESPEDAAWEEMEVVEGCGASAGITLEGAVLEETEVVEVFLAVWGRTLEIGGGTLGIVVEGPLEAETVEGRLTATIVEEVGKMFGE